MIPFIAFLSIIGLLFWKSKENQQEKRLLNLAKMHLKRCAEFEKINLDMFRLEIKIQSLKDLKDPKLSKEIIKLQRIKFHLILLKQSSKYIWFLYKRPANNH